MGRPVRRERVPSLRRANIERLERLAGALAARGIGAALSAPPGRVPRLEFACPWGPEHDIYAGRCQDGSWWYWWPWAERIASDRDPAGAAAAIEEVLGRLCPAEAGVPAVAD